MGEMSRHDGHGEGAASAGLDRRRVLGMAAGAGLIAFLGACSGTSSSKRARVGEPIPESPVYSPLSRRNREPRRSVVVPPRTPEGMTVLGRQTWAGGSPIMERANRMGRVRRVTVHHDGMDPFTSSLYDDAARRLEMIRRSHVGNGWADIGYHYAIDPAGRIWQARPEHLQGAHVKDRNENNVGILVMGNFQHQRPTAEAQRALDALIATKLDEHRLGIDAVYTHREWARTLCPGTHLQRHMAQARSSGGSIAQSTVRVRMA